MQICVESKVEIFIVHKYSVMEDLQYFLPCVNSCFTATFDLASGTAIFEWWGTGVVSVWTLVMHVSCCHTSVCVNCRCQISITALCLALPGWLLLLLLLLYPGGSVPEETFTHSHSFWSSNVLYQFPPSTTIHSFLLVQFMAWQSFSTTSLQVLFGLFLGLEPTSYSIHFSSQSLSSFHNTCPHHHNLFLLSYQDYVIYS